MTKAATQAAEALLSLSAQGTPAKGAKAKAAAAKMMATVKAGAPGKGQAGAAEAFGTMLASLAPGAQAAPNGETAAPAHTKAAGKAKSGAAPQPATQKAAPKADTEGAATDAAAAMLQPPAPSKAKSGGPGQLEAAAKAVKPAGEPGAVPPPQTMRPPQGPETLPGELKPAAKGKRPAVTADTPPSERTARPQAVAPETPRLQGAATPPAQGHAPGTPQMQTQGQSLLDSTGARLEATAHAPARIDAPTPTLDVKAPPPGTAPPPAVQIAAIIARKSADGQTRFEIRLDPPELGRIDVRLELGTDQRIQAHLTVERPATLDLLARDQRTLELALRQSGLDVNAGDLSFSLARDGGSENQPSDRFAAGRSAASAAEDSAAEAVRAVVHVAASRGLLDLSV